MGGTAHRWSGSTGPQRHHRTLIPVAQLVTTRNSIQKDIDMTVPTDLLIDLAHERQAAILRHALGAGQRALIRSARPRTLTARIARRLTAQVVATPSGRPGVDLAEPRSAELAEAADTIQQYGRDECDVDLSS